MIFLRLDFVFLNHRRSAMVRAGIRLFKDLNWTLPDPSNVDFVFPSDTDPFLKIFRNTETHDIWSLNDLWLQIQEATDPFSGVFAGERPIVKTVGFPYPGNVTVDTPNGTKFIGDVLLSFAVWLETERVALVDAKKVAYASSDSPTIQRVEFLSRREKSDLRFSLQLPKDSTNLDELKIDGNWQKKKGNADKP